MARVHETNKQASLAHLQQRRGVVPVGDATGLMDEAF